MNAVDPNFTNFFIIYCPQEDTATCLNKTAGKPEDGLNITVNLTDLTAATSYNVSVYTVLSNGLPSTPANIDGRTGL